VIRKSGTRGVFFTKIVRSKLKSKRFDPFSVIKSPTGSDGSMTVAFKRRWIVLCPYRKIGEVTRKYGHNANEKWRSDDRLLIHQVFSNKSALQKYTCSRGVDTHIRVRYVSDSGGF